MNQLQSPGDSGALPPDTKDQEAHSALLGDIAKKHLMIPTLKARSSDSLDFHEVAVWNVESALSAAYDAGRQDYEALTERVQKLGYANLLSAITSLEDKLPKRS